MLKTLKQNSKRLFYKHKVVTRVTSMLLVFTLLFTSLPLGGMVASAAEVNDENTIITVEKELTEYRTEYSKTYLMSNGTLESVISANPMHYKNDSGSWLDIDSTLVLEETEDGEVYKNKAGGFDVSFPTKNENGSSVKIESGEHTIEIELVEGKKSHARKDTSNKNKAKKLTKEQRKIMTASELYAVDSNQNSALEYNEVYDNTNIRYDINPTSVKESVIINKAPNKKVSYSYNIKANGLMAELNDDGSIAFYEKTDAKKQTAVFVMPAPLMYDANDIYCYDIETTLKQKKGVYVLTYKPDYNWLKSKDRAYPVVLDPTTYVANSTQDAYTYSADEYQNRNIGSENQIKVGRSTWKDPEGDTFETFIRFDELPTIPEGYAISSALLMLTTKAYHGTWQELEVGAHKVTEDWTNKLNQPLPLITYLNQPDAESFPRATAHIVRGDVDTEVGFEISEIVNEWYEDPTTNYGVKLSLAETPPTDADNVLFHSSRATSGVPYLSITYDVRVPVTDIEITKSEEALDCSEGVYSFEVEATVSPENASYKKINWQVEDESVACYYDGQIYARGNGETTVIAVSVDDNTITDSFDLEITNIPTITAENFSIANLPVNNSLSLGTKCSVLALAKDSNQQDVAISNKNVAWVSSDTGVATVNELGEIAAKGVGTATITATFAGVTSSFTVTVLPTVHFDIHSNYKYLLIDETVTFTGIVTPNTTEDLRTNCRVVSYSDTITDSEGVEELEVVELTKLSDDNASANLCTEYQIKGLRAGKATLRLELVSNTNVYTEITIDVTQNSVLFREIYGNTLKQGDTWTFAENPYAKIDIGDSSIISLISGTTIKAVNPGTTSVEVWLRDRAAFTHRTVIVEEDFKITITNKPVFYDSNGNKHADTIYVGQTYRDLGLQGNLKNITSVEVVSGDDLVATAYYEMAKGRIVLQGISPGVAPITVYVNEQTIPAATFDLNVTLLPVDGFFIESYGKATEDGVLYLYETGMLALDIYPLQALSSFNKADWYVRVGNKDTVSFTPYSKYQVKVKAEKEGLVEIDAIINGKYANNTFPLTVKRPKINITNRPTNNQIQIIGDTFPLNWNVDPTYATVKWYSKNPSIASIDENTGKITTNAFGSVQIYAIGKYSGCKFTKTFTLKVGVPVAKVTITNKPTNNILKTGQTHQLGFAITPANATYRDITWISSDSNVATVDKNGKITTKLAGVTTISAVAKGKTQTFDLSVIQTLTGADTYITDNNIKSTILNSKNIYDNAENQYLSGAITKEQKETIQKEMLYAADLARADHIVANEQSDFAYQYFKGRNKRLEDYYPFNRSLQLGDTGIDVMIFQRGMQAIGWFEPDINYIYGTFDQATYDAAINADRIILSSGVFDVYSYWSIFDASTQDARRPEWLENLLEYSIQHDIVKNDLAARLNAKTEVTIKNGGPSGNNAGRADILRDAGGISEIWEVKHNSQYSQAVAQRQLNRYLSAANNESNQQNFTTPLLRGQPIIPNEYYIPYKEGTYLKVFNGPETIRGLVCYEQVSAATLPADYVPVPAKLPQADKKYEYQLKPVPVGYVVGATVAIISAPIVAMTVVYIGPYLYVLCGTLAVPLSQAPRVLQELGTVA